MIERVLGHLAAHGIDEAVLSLGYRPDAFINAYPDGDHRRRALDLRRRADARSTRPVPSGSPPTTPASTTPSSCSTGTCSPTSTCRPWSTSTGRGGRGHHRPHPGRRPERLRRGAHRRRRAGRGLHREAPPGRGPDQSHQRRHLRLRAVGAGPDPRPIVGCRSNGRPSRPWSRTAPCTPWARTPTGSTPARRTPTCGPTATSCRAAGPGLPAPGAVLDPISGPGSWRIGEVDVRGSAWCRSLLGRGRRWRPVPRSTESVVGAGAVVEEGAVGDGLGAPAGRPGGRQGQGGRLDRSARAPSSANGA